MNVEMDRLEIIKIVNDDIKGWFSLEVEKYNYLIVDYEYKKNNLLFRCGINSNKEGFSKWLSYEGESYKTFLLHYLNEIRKVYRQASFKGKVIEETFNKKDFEYFELVTQYDGIPNEIIWCFFPDIEAFRLSYQIPIPINSKGTYGGSFIDEVLDYSIIQRMWEPIRSKTRYRLQLLHMLR